LFWNSQTDVEQAHIVAAYIFELSKVQRPFIRERMVTQILPNIAVKLAQAVGQLLGIDAPSAPTASHDELAKSTTEKSQALSLMVRLPGNIKHRKIAILVGNGVDANQVNELKKRLKAEGATGKVIAPSMAPVKAADGSVIETDAMLNGLPSVTMDAVIIPGGKASVAELSSSGQGRYYLQEAYKHLKVIVLLGEAKEMLAAAGVPEDEGILLGEGIHDVFDRFRKALGQHRVWSRDSVANDMPA